MPVETIGKAIRKTGGKIKVTEKTNKITIDIPKQGKLAIYINEKNEVSKATLEGKILTIQQFSEIFTKIEAKYKFTSYGFLACTTLPPCPWVPIPGTKLQQRLCLPGYTCT